MSNESAPSALTCPEKPHSDHPTYQDLAVRGCPYHPTIEGTLLGQLQCGASEQEGKVDEIDGCEPGSRALHAFIV
jgi:hypothetical protein